MPVRRSSSVAARVVAVSLAVLLGMGAIPAFAGVDDAVFGESPTNPNIDPDAWRRGWGNSVVPIFKFTGPSQVDGFIYLIDRNAGSVVDTDNPGIYYRSPRPDGTLWDYSLDLLGRLEDDPSMDGTLWYPGFAEQPVEGLWFWHFNFFAVDPITLDHTYGIGHNYMFGVDLTRPEQVAGLQVYSNATTTTPASGWLAQDFAQVRWNYIDYDQLAGTAYFRVWVDGELKIPSEPDPALPTRGVTGVPWFGTGGVGAVTIENLGPGKHTLQVEAVDRATNVGPKSAPKTVMLDLGVPTVKLLTPTSNGGRLGVTPSLNALATDDAGISKVEYYCDGELIKTLSPTNMPTSYNAAYVADLYGFDSGSHTLMVKAYDMYGREVSASKDFVLDRTSPTLSLTSAGPSPFYPRKRDGYKDNYVVKLKSSESATAKLVIKDSSGKTWRTITKPVSSGSSAISWNGKSSSGSLKQGTFRWTLRLTDAAGNSSSIKSGRATVRFYEVIQTSSNTVKIISR